MIAFLIIILLKCVSCYSYAKHLLPRCKTAVTALGKWRFLAAVIGKYGNGSKDGAFGTKNAACQGMACGLGI